METKLLELINFILEKKKSTKRITELNSCSLRKDLNFDSLDLAELTVKIEDEFDVDIFENGIVDTTDEIIEIIRRKDV